MKTLLKIAMGVAFAGFLFNLLAKKRAEERFDDRVGMGATDPGATDPATLGAAEDGDSERDWTPQESRTFHA
jgi:hypothetical protein